MCRNDKLEPIFLSLQSGSFYSSLS
jgi:hypothetical protein